ncbi:MAG: hypothetical protein SF339_18895 [Blastocatellia bacterium]|nr:hypothetical protein [Blastocatellia bacterium]
MRSPHTLPATRSRLVVMTGVFLLVAGLLFTFSSARPAAAARAALAARVGASPVARKILSAAPAQMRSAVQKRLAPLAANRAAGAVPGMAPYTITMTAAPPSGSTVGQGQIITYTINITNNGGIDVTSGSGFIRAFDASAPETLFQFNPGAPNGVMTQPGAGSAWSCAITPNGNGTNQFTCSAGDGAGGAADTFAAGATVVLKVDALVSNAATPGSTKTNSASFQTDLDGNGINETFIDSASVSHLIAPSVDLAVAKISQTAAASAGEPQNSVLAGGASTPMTSLSDLGNEGRGDVSYALTLTNLGNNAATNVTIQDSVPAGPAELVMAAPVAGAVTGQPIIPGFPGVTSISVNSGGSATQFRINCANFAIGQTFTCVPADNTAIDPAFIAGLLPKGFQGRLGYRLRVSASASLNSIVSNAAQISTNGAVDINGGNNTSLTTQNVVITKTDLGIAKVTSNLTPVAGGAAFSYTLTVTNNGPSDAKNVLVTDPLPPGVIFQNVSVVNNPSLAGYGLSCAGPAVATNGTVSCTGNLPGPNGGVSTSTITIVAQIVPNVASGVRTNTASVTSSTQEVSPNVSPNTASVQQEIEVNAPLSITKAGPATVCAGDSFTYSITVNNGGSSTALNATISDPLPANTTFESMSGTGAFANACSHNGGVPGTITCSTIDIPTGLHKLNITVKLAPSAPTGPLSNTATITSAGTGSIAVGTSTTTAQVNHCADLSLTKTAPDVLVAGSVIDYKLKITNLGGSDITGGAAPGVITIVDTLPPQVTSVISAVSGPGEGGGFTCTTAGASPILVTCVNAAGAAGNFPIGAMANIVIKVRIDSGATPGTNIQNCATITTPTPTSVPQIDTNTANNTSCDSSVVEGSADLGASKTAVPVVDPDGAGPLAPVALPVVGPNVPAGSVNAGGYIRYDIPFGNSGPSDAGNVLLTDQLPGNTAFVGALATGGVYVPAAQPPAIPFTFTVQAVDTVAPLGPNVSLTCTVTGAPGSQAVYCRPLGNTGLTPSYADGTLPAGYGGTVTLFAKVNESVSGGTIVANPANITSGLCANTGPSPFPPVTCGATADPNPGNNTTLATQTLVIASSNLTVSKIVQSAVTSASNPNQTGPLGPATPPNGAVTTGTAVLPGTFLTYRITLTNNGPSDVSNIRLIDVLPSGLETPPGRVLGAKYISVSPVFPSGATFTCAPPAGVSPANNPQGNGGTLQCTAPLLSANAPNNVAAIDVTVFIDPATRGNLVDTATFDATINNLNRPVSGSTTLTTPVAPTADLALTKTHTNAAGVVGGPVTAGTTFLYTVTATNNGPSTGHNFTLVDTLPPFQKVTKIEVGRLDGNGLFVTPNAKDGNQNPTFNCAANPAIGSAGNTTSVTCTASELPPNKNVDNTINPAGTVVFRLTVDQDQFTPQPTPTTYQNCVTATSGSTDPVPANNTNICDTVPVIFSADVTGAKTDSPDPVIAGTNLTYTITATNNGPSAALNLRIADPIPAGTVFVSAAASAGATLVTPAINANGTVTATWDAAGGTTIGLTGVGVVRTLTIVVRVCPDFQQTQNLTDAQMCVPNLTNTATISSLTPDPVPGNNTASATTTVQAQSDLVISKSGPVQAQYSTTGNASNITYTLTFSNNGPSNSSGTMIVDVLPKGFTVVGTPTSTVPGTTFTVTTLNGVSTVKANLGVLGAANQCTLTRPTSGTITIVANVPIKHPTITVTNVATISTTNCLADPNLANNTATFDTKIVPPAFNPGAAYPALAESSDQKEGSILFFPIYTSDAANGNTQNTRISITNTSPTERAVIHLFAIDGSSCSVLDAFICLTPNQTSSFLASDFDPGSTGYLVALAVEEDNGLPRAFNELIGDEFVKFATGHQANLGAEAVAASMMFPGGTDPSVTSTTLRFDGISYNRLPRVLALDNIFSPVDGNSTLLVVNRIGGNFDTSGATIGNISGLLYDDAEASFSFTANPGSCQFRSTLSNTFPRTFTPFNRVIPAGRTGWMKFWAVDDRALFGAAINFNPASNASSGAFNQGHNLHRLTLTSTATITVPVFIPSC